MDKMSDHLKIVLKNLIINSVPVYHLVPLDLNLY